MPKVTKKLINPFGLTLKQHLFIEDIAQCIKMGAAINPSKSIEKIYTVKNHNTAKSMASENLTKPNVHDALISLLTVHGILGSGGQIEKALVEGLNAVIVTGGHTKHPHAYPDHNMRLKYIQEIHKIAGMY